MNPGLEWDSKWSIASNFNFKIPKSFGFYFFNYVDYIWTLSINPQKWGFRIWCVYLILHFEKHNSALQLMNKAILKNTKNWVLPETDCGDFERIFFWTFFLSSSTPSTPTALIFEKLLITLHQRVKNFGGFLGF